jgi:hypothetical protein
MFNPFKRAEVARQEVTEAEARAAAAGVTADDLARAAEVARLSRIAAASQGLLDARERAAEVEQREHARAEAVTAHAAAVEREQPRIAAASAALSASEAKGVKLVRNPCPRRWPRSEDPLPAVTPALSSPVPPRSTATPSPPDAALGRPPESRARRARPRAGLVPRRRTDATESAARPASVTHSLN